MSATRYLAIDLGGESGRVLLGTLEAGRLSLDEVYRFPNHVVTLDGHLHWDLAHLEKEIFAGVEKAAQSGEAIESLSTDSWAVDYVLLDQAGDSLGLPFCYRDARNHPSAAGVVKKLSFPVIYRETGIQFLSFNTLFQLEAESKGEGGALQRAHHFLAIADYFNARFSGVSVMEESMASATQIYNPQSKNWSKSLVSFLGKAPSFFPPIVPSGTVLGPVSDRWRQSPALSRAQVVATCSHDTGAAVAAVPAVGTEKWAYLSSGTWSLLGAELATPLLTDQAREAGFTNEVGLDGTIRFLKNIAGLWVLQECRRAWKAAGQTYDYDEMTRLGLANGPASAHISLQDPRFVSAGGMPDKISDYCRETGQAVPSSAGQFIRTILESLALCYAQTLAQLEELIGHPIDQLHIVGGGSRNDLLNQLTADATGLTIVAGPVEATAIGNILIQAQALGHLSHQPLRSVVQASFPTRTFRPQGAIPDAVRNRFCQLSKP